MSRIAKSDVENALRVAANKIIEAGGADGIISRGDVKDLLTRLDGIERRLVDVFFRFIDYRDAKKGARVTKKDVDEAVEYARVHMIEKYDLNRNGLSEEEIARMSLTGRLAVAFARILKRAALKSEDQQSKILFEQIQELSQKLFFDDFGSEASEKISAVYQDTNFSELTPETFAKAMDLDFNKPAQQLARFEPVGTFWEDFVDIQFPENRQQAQDLVALMRANLRDIHVIIQGADQFGVDPEHPVFVVGLTGWGDIVGFRSIVVWT